LNATVTAWTTAPQEQAENFLPLHLTKSKEEMGLCAIVVDSQRFLQVSMVRGAVIDAYR